jgi:hypothetical protein
MATSTVSYNEVLIAVDPAGGSTFGHPCLINQEKSVVFTLNLSEDIVPDCDNPTNPAQVFRHADSIDLTISGTGKVHVTDVKTYADVLAAGTAIPAKLRIGAIDTTGAIEVSVDLYVQSMTVSTTRPNTAEIDISFAADGFQASDIAAYATP